MFTRLKPKLFPRAMRTCNGNVHDAEEPVQDVFLALVERLSEIKKWKSLTAYAHGIMRNKCSQWIKEKQKTEERIVPDRSDKDDAVVFIWSILQNEPSGTTFSIAGVTYRAWGDKKSLESLQLGETPPALQSPQVSRHIGFLTEALIKVLQHPKNTEEFWKALKNALAEQKITMPPSLWTLVIEDSLFSDIRAKQVASNREIWILFYRSQIMLIRWAE